jgi:two-component system, cell cycle response regulator DivK
MSTEVGPPWCGQPVQAQDLLYWPVGRSPAVPEHPMPEESASPRVRPLILLAEDSSDTREMYGAFLESCGYEVAHARSGREALATAHEQLPDVIVLDLGLPDLDGADVTRALRRAAGQLARSIRIVCLSGHPADSPEAATIIEAGSDAYLTKPCLPDALAEQIGRTLSAAGGASAERPGRTRRTL